MNKYIDIYDESELRSVYGSMFPRCNFDDDCFFAFARFDGYSFLLDPSLSMAEEHGDPSMASFPFYSEKGEKRVRSAQAECKQKHRIPVDSFHGNPNSGKTIVVGLTPGQQMTVQ